VTLRFEIDELVLHGFDSRDRRGIADAIQAELVAALADFRAAAAADIAHVDAGAFTAPVGAGPHHIGRAIASQLRAGIDACP
jgi:hypothetical protein